MGIRFYGVVHEHPEIEINEGPGAVMITHEAQIVHPAYSHEAVRRKRFERNMPLLIRDREKYPDRQIGKFLWLRDLSQMNDRSLEMHGFITDTSIKRAKEGVAMWNEILEDGVMRLIIESLPFYSRCVQFLGEGFTAEVSVNTGKYEDSLNGSGTKLMGSFSSKEDYLRLMELIVEDKTSTYESKYFG